MKGQKREFRQNHHSKAETYDGFVGGSSKQNSGVSNEVLMNGFPVPSTVIQNFPEPLFETVRYSSWPFCLVC